MLLQIVASRDDLAELILTVSTAPGQRGSQILVRGQRNLVETTFSRLHMLYLQPNVNITCESMIGQLVSSKECADNMCGSTMPMSLLQQRCEAALTLPEIIVSLRLHSFILLLGYFLLIFCLSLASSPPSRFYKFVSATMGSWTSFLGLHWMLLRESA